MKELKGQKVLQSKPGVPKKKGRKPKYLKISTESDVLSSFFGDSDRGRLGH